MSVFNCIRPLVAGAALCGLLAACGSEPPASEGDGETAAGEVLEGTISDAMIPLDQLRSQPPLMKVEPAPDAAAAPDGASEPAADPNADDDAAPAPPPAEPASAEES